MVTRKQLINKKTIMTGVLIAVIGAVALGVLNWIKDGFTDIIKDRQIRNEQVEKNKRDIIRIKRKLRM